MTVYELVQKLIEFKPSTKVVVGVYGKTVNFDEYKAEAEGADTMDVGANPVEVEYPYYNADGTVIEIVCDLERL